MTYQKSHKRGLQPAQASETNTSTTAISHNKTVRFDDLSTVTSGFGGKFLPVAMIPLLREDRAMSSTLSLNFQMSETSDMLLNPVRATASAWLVPKMAFDRFSGYDSINRSYNGQPEIDDTVIPWFDTHPYTWDGTQPWEFYQKLGLHAATDAQVSTDYMEAYNCVWNHIAKNMSLDIAQRAIMEPSIAPAFWDHTQMKHVKATFDDAMMEGQVPIEFVGNSNQLPVRGIHAGTTDPAATVSDAGIILGGTGGYNIRDMTDASVSLAFDINAAGSNIFAELAAESVQLTLANIDLARETAAWARLRTRYQGLDEDWMMDQLLAGISMPEEGMRQPILLDKQSVPFGMVQRYATDGANLQQSATNGQTAMQLRIRTPPVNTGGVIVVCAQALPEMVFERQRDYYLTATTVAELPNRTADELDPQPVVEIYNGEVDELHSLPTDVFGYAPLNHQWMRNKPKIGGRYFRYDPNGPWDEDRNRIWDTTTVDPKLGEDFYLASNLRHDVFMTTTEDPFEIWVNGRVPIEGLTHFGPSLRESTDDYDKVLEQVDTTRITPPATTAQDEAE